MCESKMFVDLLLRRKGKERKQKEDDEIKRKTRIAKLKKRSNIL